MSFCSECGKKIKDGHAIHAARRLGDVALTQQQGGLAFCRSSCFERHRNRVLPLEKERLRKEEEEAARRAEEERQAKNKEEDARRQAEEKDRIRARKDAKIKSLRDKVALEPGSWAAHCALGEALAESREYADAGESYLRAIALGIPHPYSSGCAKLGYALTQERSLKLTFSYKHIGPVQTPYDIIRSSVM